MGDGGAELIGERLVTMVGTAHVDVGDAVADDACHDESLGTRAVRPVAVVRPGSTADVVAVVKAAGELGVPVTARGSGTGLSGACTPIEGGIVVSFERMSAILEIDEANQVAVVEPGVTLADLDAELAPLGLVYPVFPGEQSASLGGNVSTNAGGMRAVKYGVTRHHVLGLEAVLGTGEVMTTGGRFVKATSGYDLTQLIVGSEGTLALVTRVILRLHPRPPHQATLLAPFATVDLVAEAVPPVVASGVGPLLVEYIDMISMAGITANAGIDLGIPDGVRDRTLAYLVIVLEGHHISRVEEDTEALATLLGTLGALDVYVLPDHAGHDLIVAREHTFWASRPPEPTTSSTPSYPAPPSPPFWPWSGSWPMPTGHWSSAAGMPGTATSISPCSSPMPASADGWSTTSWPPEWSWVAPSRGNMGSAPPSWRRSPTWRTR